jgi:hypothetical protein
VFSFHLACCRRDKFCQITWRSRVSFSGLFVRARLITVYRTRAGLSFTMGACGSLIGNPINGELLGDSFAWNNTIIFTGVSPYTSVFSSIAYRKLRRPSLLARRQLRFHDRLSLGAKLPAQERRSSKTCDVVFVPFTPSRRPRI